MATAPPSSLSIPDSSGSLHHSYSRKQKSLGLLCSNFLSFYNNRDGEEDSIGLDDAAMKLGVERRRIYDIVNVLESVGVICRKGKNQYTWKGLKWIPKALEELKAEGLRESEGLLDGIHNAKVLDDVDDDETYSNPNGSQSESYLNPYGSQLDSSSNLYGSQPESCSDPQGSQPEACSNPYGSQSEACSDPYGSQTESYSNPYGSQPEACGSQPEVSNTNTVKAVASSKPDTRREKSLGLLTRNFVKLFLCTKADLISLEDAAKVLLGDGHSTVIMRTKVRRLYDIANVLSSMELIEKIHHPATRKPAFRWLGFKEKRGNLPDPLSANGTKRVFGDDLTNICNKRNKTNEDTKQLKNGSLENASNIIDIDPDTKQSSGNYNFGPFAPDKLAKKSSGNYHFGPFAPVTVAKVGPPQLKKTKQVLDWESLSETYRPRYDSKALRDLFYHYKNAFDSWCYEVAGE